MAENIIVNCTLREMWDIFQNIKGWWSANCTSIMMTGPFCDAAGDVTCVLKPLYLTNGKVLPDELNFSKVRVIQVDEKRVRIRFLRHTFIDKSLWHEAIRHITEEIGREGHKWRHSLGWMGTRPGI